MKKIVCAVLLGLFAGIAHCEPMYIDFYEMMEKSTQIFVGTYIEPKGPYNLSHTLMVETSLKGSLAQEEQITYITSGQVGFKKGDRFVAFINNDQTFEWVGLPVDLEITEFNDNTLLKLEGFYDFNAYLVGPAILTMGQLKQYIKEKKYDSKISGNVHCFSNQTLKMEKQDVVIDIAYTYKGKENGTTDIKVNGMSWYTFHKKPYLTLGSWAAEVDLKFELNKYRSLTIVGKLDGKNNNGVLNAYFWVQEPRELTFEELKEFITHDNYQNPYYELELKTTKSGTYIIELDKESGRIGYIKNYNGRDLSISSTQDRDNYGWERHIAANLDDNSQLYLLLDTTSITEAELEFTYEDLIRQMKIEGGKGKMVIRKKVAGKEDQHVDAYVDEFILTYKRTLFVLLNNPK